MGQKTGPWQVRSVRLSVSGCLRGNPSLKGDAGSLCPLALPLVTDEAGAPACPDRADSARPATSSIRASHRPAFQVGWTQVTFLFVEGDGAGSKWVSCPLAQKGCVSTCIAACCFVCAVLTLTTKRVGVVLLA